MNKSVWRIVKILTLAIPLPVFLFLNATLFSIVPDYTINANISTVHVIELDEAWFIYTDDLNASIDGLVVRHGEYNGIFITTDDIIKIERGFYSWVERDGNYELADIRRMELQQQQSYKIPLTFFISLGGVLVVVLIVQGKMNWHKDHPKGAVLLSLITGTVVLYIIDLIVSSIFGVFLMATISWALYLLADLLQNNQLTSKEAEQTESDVIRALKEALK